MQALHVPIHAVNTQDKTFHSFIYLFKYLIIMFTLRSSVIYFPYYIKHFVSFQNLGKVLW